MNASLRVLIAEDSLMIARDLKRMVESTGATVLGPVPTVAGALDYVRTDNVSVALVDMNLRDEFADTLIETLVSRAIPFVIVTGYEALPMDDAHAAGVIRKPVVEGQLIALLTKIAASLHG